MALVVVAVAGSLAAADLAVANGDGDLRSGRLHSQLSTPMVGGHAHSRAVGAYTFSSAAGTWTNLNSGTSLTTVCDEETYLANPIGFTFKFDGVNYTTFSVSCNGVVALGSTMANTYGVSGNVNNVISALGADLKTDAGQIRFRKAGNSPNGVLTIQWSSMEYWNDPELAEDNLTFQVKLYETSNRIEVVYGTMTKGATARTAEVGLRGADIFNYNNRTTTTNWAASAAGTALDAAMALTSTVKPASGLTYTWTYVASPNVAFDSYALVSDACPVSGPGSGDGMYNPGENVTINVTLKNNGDLAAAGISAELISLDPEITVTSATSTFPNLAAGASGVSASSYVFNLSQALECGTSFTLYVDITSTTPAGEWLGTFPILIGPPINQLTAENFDGVTAPALPTGWAATILSGTYNWATSAGLPTPWTGGAAHSGANVAWFDCWDASAGSQARLYQTTGVNLSGQTGSIAIGFWMLHDTNYASSVDTVQVQASTDAGATWANVGAVINRPGTATQWLLHFVDATAYAGLADVRIGLLATSAYGVSIVVDDLMVTAPGPCNACYDVSMTPASEAKEQCIGQSQAFDLTIQNDTGLLATYDVTYAVTAGTGTCTGPATVGPIADGAAQAFQAQMDPALPFYDPTVCTVTITEQANPGYTAASELTLYTMPWSGDTTIPWVNRATGTEPAQYWGASYYYNGNLCVLGGLDTTPALTGAHACYNIATPGWTAKAAIPTPVFSPAFGMINGLFYLAGGFADDAFTGTNALQIYDPASDTWTTGTAMPTARGGQGGGVVGGKLYSVGGSATSAFATDCPNYVYDPSTTAWTSLAECPLDPDGNGFDLGGSLGSDFWGGVFIGGGYAGYPYMYFYEVAGDAWYYVGDLHYHKTPLLLEDEATGTIFETSGFVAWTPQSNVWAFDPGTGVWSDWPADLNTPVGGAMGPAHGSWGDATLGAFWNMSGSAGSGAASPAPLESWEQGWNYCVGDLSVTKTDGLTEVSPGQLVTYTIVVTNNGPADLVGATVVDSMPAFLNGVTWTCVAAGGGTCTASGSGSINDLVDLPYAATATYTVTGTVDAGASGSLVNTVTVGLPAGIYNLDATDDTATDTDTIVALAYSGDMDVYLNDLACAHMQGDTFNYTIVVSNAGPDAVNAFTVDTFPATLINVGWTCVGAGGGTCTASGTGNLNDPVYLPVSGSVTYTVTATVDPAAVRGNLINVVEAVAGAASSDPNLTNNTMTDVDALGDTPIFCGDFETGGTTGWIVSP